MWETFPTPGKLEGKVKASQQRANRFLINIQPIMVQLLNCSVHLFPFGKYYRLVILLKEAKKSQ